jgi:D-alanyl-D-alanine carboxypeptidase
LAVLLYLGFGELGVTLARKPVQTASRIDIIPAAHAAEALHPAPGRTKVSANWSVQVGTFASEAAARNAATSARKAAEAGEIRVEPVRLKGQTLWRAAVIGLSQTDAEDACSSRKKSGCMLIRPGQRQLASR